MKILFIETEILEREKFLNFISCTNGEGNLFTNPYPVSLHDAPCNLEDLLKELKISDEMIEQFRRSDMDKFLIILYDGIRFDRPINHLNFDFEKSENLEYKFFNVNLKKGEVYIYNKRLNLTAMEYKILLYFIYNSKKLITKNEIIDYVWGKNENQQASDVNMYTHIKNLKRKLSKSGLRNFIHTAYGQGYRFEDPDDVIL